MADFTLKHEGEVRRDLVAFGYTLDTVGTDAGLGWADFVAFVQHAPEGSAIFRAIYADENPDNPGDFEWTLDRMLLASLVDEVAVLIWQNGSRRLFEYPEPIPRPGTRREKAFAASSTDIDELNARLGISDLL